MSHHAPRKAAGALSPSAATSLPSTSRKRTSKPRSKPDTQAGKRRPKSQLGKLCQTENSNEFIDPATLPERYVLLGRGDCMAPAIPDGSMLAFTKKEHPERGDIVALWFRPEAIQPGALQVSMKRLAMPMPPFKLPYRPSRFSNCEPLVIVEMDNPSERFAIPFSALLAVHKFVGIAEETRPGFARLQPTEGVTNA